MIAIDTNVLVYSVHTASPLHENARAALRRVAEGTEPFGLPVFVIGEFIRVVTSSRLARAPLGIRTASETVDQLLAGPNTRILSPGPRFWQILKGMIDDGDVSGATIFDAQIAAVCRENGVDTILTEDRDYTRFTGFDVRRLAR